MENLRSRCRLEFPVIGVDMLTEHSRRRSELPIMLLALLSLFAAVSATTPSKLDETSPAVETPGPGDVKCLPSCNPTPTPRSPPPPSPCPPPPAPPLPPPPPASQKCPPPPPSSSSVPSPPYAYVPAPPAGNLYPVDTLFYGGGSIVPAGMLASAVSSVLMALLLLPFW